MAITPLDIEKQLEDGLITLLQADSYISTNQIPVVRFADFDDGLVGRQVVVHANKVIPGILDENGEAVDWEVLVDLLQYIHKVEDETPGTETKTIYQLLLGFVMQTTKTQIQATLDGLTVNGKNTSASGESDDDRFYAKAASMTIYIK